MPPVWSGRKCFIVSLDQLVAWHKLKKSRSELAVLSLDPDTRELHVIADQVELTVVRSGRVENFGSPSAHS